MRILVRIKNNLQQTSKLLLFVCRFHALRLLWRRIWTFFLCLFSSHSISTTDLCYFNSCVNTTGMRQLRSWLPYNIFFLEICYCGYIITWFLFMCFCVSFFYDILTATEILSCCNSDWNMTKMRDQYILSQIKFVLYPNNGFKQI